MQITKQRLQGLKTRLRWPFSKIIKKGNKREIKVIAKVKQS